TAAVDAAVLRQFAVCCGDHASSRVVDTAATPATSSIAVAGWGLVARRGNGDVTRDRTAVQRHRAAQIQNAAADARLIPDAHDDVRDGVFDHVERADIEDAAAK